MNTKEVKSVREPSVWQWLKKYAWRIPLITLGLHFILLLTIYWLGRGQTAEWLVWAYLVISVLSVLLLLAVAIEAFVHRRVKKGIGIIVADIVWLAVLFVENYLVSMLFFFTLPDHYADRHPIPEGLELNEPLNIEIVYPYRDTSYTAALVDTADPQTWLQLAGEMGRYRYDFYYPELEDGDIFLRCFEAGSGDPLSEEHITFRTWTEVKGHKEFGQVANMRQKDFQLYEGDLGEYYAVRVEVWHQNIYGEEHKLLEKLYRMDGWTR